MAIKIKKETIDKLSMNSGKSPEEISKFLNEFFEAPVCETEDPAKTDPIIIDGKKYRTMEEFEKELVDQIPKEIKDVETVLQLAVGINQYLATLASCDYLGIKISDGKEETLEIYGALSGILVHLVYLCQKFDTDLNTTLSFAMDALAVYREAKKEKGEEGKDK